MCVLSMGSAECPLDTPQTAMAVLINPKGAIRSERRRMSATGRREREREKERERG